MRLSEAKKLLSKEAYDECRQKYQIARNTNTRSASNDKSNSFHVPVAAILPAMFNTKVRIRIHSIRHRLADEENLFGKYVVDAIRYSGILKDDSPKHVTGPYHTQEIGEKEETIITIEEIET
jgi:hypothetical protein